MKSFTDRQKEIISASIGIIAKKGIQQLTIKNISKEIGISEPGIYRHFESKMDILLAILAQFKEHNQVISSKIISHSASSLLAIIGQVLPLVLYAHGCP
jgi:AcrR family transcriptional regulator